ncbi:MAG TPA: hypothetical protein VK308_02585, partial [Pyrinomonadaceae bacterium]|nr:hypothetical protein [Pyrinomonadaceae bacterium]
MMRKLLAFTILLAAGAALEANAQDSPTAPKDNVVRKAERVFFNAPFGRSYLGVQTQEISKENFAKFGLSSVRGVGI